MEVNELLRVWDRESTEKHGIHDAEDGGVGANSKSNGEDRNGGENRRLGQLAKRVSKTLNSSHHASTSALKRSYKARHSRPGTKMPGEERFRLQEVTYLSEDYPKSTLSERKEHRPKTDR
jgi:hypothetical protein